MRIHKIILPLVASTMLLTGCDDQKMEWGKPDGHYGVTAADIPLEVKEVLANYSDIKDYSAQYHPNMILGLGVGAAIYLGDDGRGELANANFQQITLGNAMKADALVKNDGSLNFETVDRVIAAMPSDMKLYGHNFVWYQQQNQTYLKSLIAPTFTVETDGDIANILKNGYFDEDISGWMGWGNDSERSWDATGGVDGSGAAKIVVPKSGNQWDVQFCQDLTEPLQAGKTYVLRFKARTNGSGHVQCCVQQPSGSYPAVGYETFEVGTSWVTCEKEISFESDGGNSYTRLCINTGADIGTYWIDNVEFGEKIANPDAHRTNLLKNGEFDTDISEWQKWNGDDGCNTWNADEGNRGAGCLQVVNATDQTGNQWKVQIHANFLKTIPEGTKFYVSYYIKCAAGTGSVRCSTTGNAHYQGDQAVNTEWQRIEWEVTAGGDVEGLNFDLAQMANTYLIDDVVVSLEPFTAEAGAKARAPRRKASKIIYTFKTDKEKQEVLTNALEAFIKGVAEHLAEKGVTPSGYDVINEAIADGNGYAVRGIRDANGNAVFGGSTTDDDGVTTYDGTPEETETDGLNLNWGNNRFYWGYYVPDYGVKAFQFARQYLPAETKLFINDYNLETSTGKLAALINWVKEIDAANGSAIVDGIGTQMHITLSGTSDDAENNAAKVAALREQVDTQFKTLAATGKLIRVTELDIALGTSSPSAAQYKAQSDAYQAIFQSYFENIPEAQQSGITIWSLTDADDEHEYWLKGDLPNLFDKSFKRKWAYKGVCDGIAGEDLGLKYGGEDYKAFYEKNNVSDTVK